MSFSNRFHSYNNPYYSFPTVQFTRNPLLNTYSFYQNYNPNHSQTNQFKAYYDHFKNTTDTFFNSFYPQLYPQLRNFSTDKVEPDKENEEKNEKTNNEEENQRSRRRFSVSNLINSAKNKVNSHTRSKSIDESIFKNNFDTMPYSIRYDQRRTRSYSSDEEHFTSPRTQKYIPIKNILLPEIIINNVRYNRPELVLQNYSYYAKGEPVSSSEDLDSD